MIKKVIICSAHHWKSPIQISAHQLARQFVLNGWQVAFISNPISILHWLLAKNSITDLCIHTWKNNGQWEQNGKLFYYCPLTLMPLLSATARYQWVINKWHGFTVPNIIQVLRKNNFDNVDLIILDTALQSYLLDLIKSKKSIYRITDFNPGFSSSTLALTHNEHQLIKKVDHVVITGAKLSNYAASMGAKDIIHISHGVNFDFFSKGRYDRPTEFCTIKGPIAIFVGSIGEWFDTKLLEEVASILSDVSFVIIGPNRNLSSCLKHLNNIYILGPRPYESIPQYLQHSDVGIIPFDAHNYPALVHAINPIKLYEYMACGLPVVATDWEELRSLNTPTYLCNDAATFAENIKEAIKSKIAVGHLGKEFSAKSDWKNKYNELMRHINVL